MGWIGDTVEQCERMLDHAAVNGYRVKGAGRSAGKSKAIEQRAQRPRRSLSHSRYVHDQIVALWSRGTLTHTEIALQVGCSKNTVSTVICTRGLSQRRRPARKATP